MDHHALRHRFAALTTAHVADACLRAQVPVRCAPAFLRAAARRLDARPPGALESAAVGDWTVSREDRAGTAPAGRMRM